MRLQTLVSATIMATATLTSPALADKAILVLDGSGSMWGQIEGENKIVIARETVGTLMADWPASTELGLIAYGHREKGNCGDIETLVPVGSGTASAVDAAVGTLNPKGKTPITAAVHQAAAELRSTEEKATVILVSDGLETCNADPCAAAAELEANGIDFTVHVIGFGTTPEENQQLQCLADNTGGKFLGAANASELKTAMAEVKEVVVKVQKIKAATGSLQLVNNNLHQRVYDENGKQAAAGVFKKAEQLPPGRYAMRYGKITIIENFEINAGEELVIDLADHIGWFQLVNSSSQQYLYDESGKKISGGLFRNAVQLPPGRYSMKSGNVTTVEDFEIKAGEKLVLDLDESASLDEPAPELSQSKSKKPARTENELNTLAEAQQNQHQMLPPLNHEAEVNNVVFSKDESKILTTSRDGTARLYDAATGEELIPSMRHEKSVKTAMFSKDETKILTSSNDGTARLYDAATGEELIPTMRHEGRVSSAVFSKDETKILTSSGDGTVRLFDATTNGAR